jgi:hypothetical protein
VALAVIAIAVGFLVFDWARHRHDPESIEATDGEYVPADE